MVLSGIVEFLKYREWTESLGRDREWYIQVVQSRLYQKIQELSSGFDGLTLPLRYDIQLVMLPSSANAGRFINALRASLRPHSPTPVRIRLLCGDVPEVFERFKGLKGSSDYWEVCRPSEMVVAHADLNNFTKATRDSGPYRTYVKVMDLLSKYVNALRGRAVVQYLGGDNVAAITSLRYMNEVIDVLTGFEGVKVGVGVSERPREALALAAEALSSIRREGRVRKYYVIRSGADA